MLILSLCAGMSFAEDAAFEFDHKITIVCPWGEGGGADSTLRALKPLLEKTIGQEIEIMNVTGNNGANGAAYVKEHEADGYTFLLGTQSLLIQEISGAMKFKFLDEFVPVARLVNATNIIAASKKTMEERGYNSFSELRDYIKAHPSSVSVGMLTSTGVDGL